MVIGSGSVFLLEYGARFAQDLKTILDTNKAEKARVERNAALTRRTKECRARSIVFFGEETVPAQWDDFYEERKQWIAKCQKESVPVEQLPKSWMRLR